MANQALAASTAGAVQIKRGDKLFDGSFTVSGDTITVAYLAKTKKARLGSSAPEGVARKLLTELVNAAPHAKKLKSPG
jgi:hypothetical protein